MKFTLLRENFQKVLAIIQRIVVKNPSLPILENVLIETEDKKLKLSATNLELGIYVWAKGRMEEGGRVSVPAFLLGNIINNIKEERITIISKGFDLEIEAQNFTALIKGQDSNDFPLIPKPEVKEKINLIRKDVVEGISPLVHVATISDIYPEISGIFFSFSKEKLTLVGTDSFRLGKKEISMRVPKEFVGKEFIVPLKSSQEIGYILGEEVESGISMGVNENQVIFYIDDIYVISRLLAGNYPNYNELIPKDFVMDVVVSRKDFLEKLKLISVFAPKTNDCRVEIKNGEIVLSASTTIGSSEAALKATIRGKGVLGITFNYKYLLDGLLHLSSKELAFHIKNETSPVVLRGVGDQSYLYLVAPLKS